MKKIIVLLLSIFSLSGYGQETEPEFDAHKWEAPYLLTVPKDWSVERFAIPISFAPQIQYNGVEDIRFSPGWGKADSDDYWTYAFLWYLDGQINFDAKIINNDLKAYFTGLISVNGQSKPDLQQIPVVTEFKEIRTGDNDLKTFTGTIQMLDYMQNKPIILNCKVHRKECKEDNKTVIFYELSPKSFSHKVWTSLDQLWLDFTCKKS